MGKKSDFNNFKCAMFAGGRRAVFQKLLICWDFPKEKCLRFRDYSLKERKYPVSISFALYQQFW